MVVRAENWSAGTVEKWVISLIFSMQCKICKVYCRKVKSTTEWQTSVNIRGKSYSNLETGRYDPKSGVSGVPDYPGELTALEWRRSDRRAAMCVENVENICCVKQRGAAIKKVIRWRIHTNGTKLNNEQKEFFTIYCITLRHLVSHFTPFLVEVQV